MVTRSYSGGGSAGTVGGQFGCQYQLGWFVLGGEWDANWSGLNEDNFFSYAGRDRSGDRLHFFPRNEWTSKQLDWFSTARVRLGAAWWDRVLVYATGGLALGALDSTTQVGFVTPATHCGIPQYFGAFREKRIGWTAGGGIEWAFAQNWTAKAEFLYLDFGSFDYISPRSTFGTPSRRDRWPHVEHQHRREGIRRARRHQLPLPSWSGRGSGCGPLLSSLSFVKTSNPGPRPGVFSCVSSSPPGSTRRSI